MELNNSMNLPSAAGALNSPAGRSLSKPKEILMLDKPRIVQTQAQLTAVIRLTIPRAQIQSVMGPAIGEVMAAIAAQGIAPAGPVFSYHLRMDPEIFDFEVGVPVTTPIAAAGRVKASQLPAATVAQTVYHGPYEGLGSAWGEFGQWIAAERHKPASDLWECYVAGPESSPDPADWRTELNRPLVR
jgi:effector-binding domain-containing protein